MRKLRWQDDWLTGVPHLDEQHKKLVKTVNKALDCINLHPNSPEVEEVIDELSKYAISHFRDEEKFLREKGYSNAKSHIEHHLNYQKELSKICVDVTNRMNVSNDDLVRHALLWWGRHILIEDLIWAKELGTLPLDSLESKRKQAS